MLLSGFSHFKIDNYETPTVQTERNEKNKLMDYQYIVENIVSKTLQNYMQENNLFFTLKELAAITYNSNMPQFWKMERLDAIAKQTDDESLKKQIKELNELEMFQIQTHYQENESSFYLLYNYETHGLEGIYLNSNAAEKAGMELGVGYRIEKYNLKNPKVLVGYSKSGFFEKEVDDLPAESWQFFDKKGNLLSFYSSAKNKSNEEMNDIFYGEDHFQTSPVYFPNPFEKGDIVRSISTGTVGVVETSQETWRKLEKHQETGYFDFWDYSLTVRPIGEKHDVFAHYHFLPIDLDYVESSELIENRNLSELEDSLLKEDIAADDYEIIISHLKSMEPRNGLIYTTMTKKAMKVCFEAHKNQVDKSGLPYVYHPFHVACRQKDEISTTVALLHDVVEDSDFSFEDLKKDFPEEVIKALQLLTHQDGERYMDYIKKIKSNPIATKVKRDDLRHNMDLSRLNDITDVDIRRIKKYQKALRYMEGPEQ